MAYGMNDCSFVHSVKGWNPMVWTGSVRIVRGLEMLLLCELEMIGFGLGLLPHFIN